MQVKVLLNTVEKIKEFVTVTSDAQFDVDLISNNRTYLDAKSLLGILSCDIHNPFVLDIHTEENNCSDYVNHIAGFLAE